MAEELRERYDCRRAPESYDMEDDVADHLCFGYETHVGTQGNTQKRWLDDDNVIDEVEYRPSGDVQDTALLGMDCLEMRYNTTSLSS